MDEADCRRRAIAWVEFHCAQQGIPVKVTDPRTAEYVASILLEGRKKRLRA